MLLDTSPGHLWTTLNGMMGTMLDLEWFMLTTRIIKQDMSRTRSCGILNSHKLKTLTQSTKTHTMK